MRRPRKNPPSKAELKQKLSEQAYYEAHAVAKAAGKSGEEMHAAGVAAQNARMQQIKDAR